MKKYNLAPRNRKQNSEEDFGISAQQLMEGGGDFFSSINSSRNEQNEQDEQDEQDENQE